MASTDPADRIVIARMGGLISAANCPDLSARAANGQRGLRARKAREIDPDGTMPAAERERRVDAALRAHMLGLARKSAATRRRNRRDPAAVAAELRAQREAGGAA